MNISIQRSGVAGLVLLGLALSMAAQDTVRVRSQNPSPMVENTRAHMRIQPATYTGYRDSIVGVVPRVVDVYVPLRHKDRRDLLLFLNFHTAAYVTHQAAESCGVDLIGVTINLGGGSSAYGNPFADSMVFPRLLNAVDSVLRYRKVDARWSRVAVAGFSAGYGAVRRLLSQPENRARIEAALLLDGIHAGYLPDRVVLAEGGRIDSTNLESFLSFARETMQPGSKKRFMITHSEVFPGTFVSTTESTDWLIAQLGLKRTPVLRWGPMGMQQTSVVRAGHFEIRGFAGNSGIDHGDHLHAVGEFLRELEGLK
jgi:hypothetical protein